MSNQDIVKLFRSAAGVLRIKNDSNDRFRIIAYENVALEIEKMQGSLQQIYQDGKLLEINGVGEGIANKISELYQTGKIHEFTKLLKSVPESVFVFMEIPGIGPKTAYKLAKKLHINEKATALEKLREALARHDIANISGMGPVSERKIAQSLTEYTKKPVMQRILLSEADLIVEQIVKYLRLSRYVLRIDPLGSIRRRVPTIGDIDISVASKNPQKVIDWFIKYPQTIKILEKGKTMASIILANSQRVDIKVQTPSSYGSLLQHFTGSKQHNIHLREIAIKKGLSLSEYGISIQKNVTKKTETTKKSKVARFNSEVKFYKHLKMAWIPPELRENNGEIELALINRLPKLVNLQDINGDLHLHSSYDTETSHDLGENSMEEIVAQASKMKYQYLAFSEHSPSRSKHSDSEITAILRSKHQYVAQHRQYWKEKYQIYVFNSLEIDIRPDGKISVPMAAMDYIDFAIASIHSLFDFDQDRMTKRIIAGLSHPKVKILGHPTGRLLNVRKGYEVDWQQLIEYCRQTNKILEINSYPRRLDLREDLVKLAVKNNVKLVINTDSHNNKQMTNMRYGIDVARRGWAEKKKIVNTLPLTGLCTVLGIDVK